MQDFRPQIPFDSPGLIDYCRPDIAPVRPLLMRSALSLFSGGGALCLFAAMWARPSDDIYLLCLLSPFMLLAGLLLAGNFINNGMIEISGGDVLATNTKSFTNNGTIDVAAGHTLQLVQVAAGLIGKFAISL